MNVQDFDFEIKHDGDEYWVENVVKMDGTEPTDWEIELLNVIAFNLYLRRK